MSKIRKIDEVRMGNTKMEGLTSETTVKKLYDRVSVIAERLREREAKEAAGITAMNAPRETEGQAPKEGEKTAFPKKKPLPDYLAQNVAPLHISDDHNTVIFENGYVYSRNESNEVVIRLGDCCKRFFDTPDFTKYADPREMTYEERQMCTVSAEIMQGLDWELAVTMVADRNCRYNNEHGGKGDRCRTDNVVMSEDGEELDIFDSYYDSREYRSIEDTVVDRMEAERLRGVAYEKLNERTKKIMDGIIADKPQEQIAKELDTNRHVIKSTVCRARKSMQQKIKDDRRKNG